jgi:hypothetical protein
VAVQISRMLVPANPLRAKSAHATEMVSSLRLAVLLRSEFRDRGAIELQT